MKTIEVVMRNVIIVIVYFLFSMGLHAQESNYKTGSLLWKISGKDLTKPSYLLGTFHVKSPDYIEQIPGCKASFESAEQVVGEVVMADMMAQVMKMQQKMMMSADTTYKMLYNDADYQTVDEGLKSIFGAGLDQLGMLRPSGIQMSFLQVLISKFYPNLNPMDVLDSHFQKMAVEKQIPVVGLESIDHQIYVLFESSSLQRQADLLLCNIKSIDGKSFDETLAKSWKDMEAKYDAGDLNALIALLKEGPCADVEGTNHLNKSRNDAWMQKLPGLMKDKSSFIAVGALHLAGEEGLLNQLEKVGYIVEAVKN